MKNRQTHFQSVQIAEGIVKAVMEQEAPKIFGYRELGQDRDYSFRAFSNSLYFNWEWSFGVSVTLEVHSHGIGGTFSLEQPGLEGVANPVAIEVRVNWGTLGTTNLTTAHAMIDLHQRVVSLGCLLQTRLDHAAKDGWVILEQDRS